VTIATFFMSLLPIPSLSGIPDSLFWYTQHNQMGL
jgi:hypothetical protein